MRLLLFLFCFFVDIIGYIIVLVVLSTAILVDNRYEAVGEVFVGCLVYCTKSFLCCCFFQ